MTNLIVVCEPQAVGKMTVAEGEFNYVFRKVAFELTVKHNVGISFSFQTLFFRLYYPKATSRTIIREKPIMNIIVPILEWLLSSSAAISGTSSSTTT